MSARKARYPTRLTRLCVALALAFWPEKGAADALESKASTRSSETPPSSLTDALELCVAEHERGRMHKTELRLFESRSALKRCASKDCPLAVRADCQNWLTDVEALVPTILIVLEGARVNRDNLRVTVDGRPIEQDLDRPIELLPGHHRVRFELPPFSPVESDISLDPGEKNRVLRIRFEASSEPPAHEGPPPGAAPPLAPPVFTLESRPVPTTTYLLGGTALLCATAAGILFGSAALDRDRAREQCAPFCPEEVRESIERKLLWADIAGVGTLVLGGLAAYSYVVRPTETKTVEKRRISLSLGKSGAGISLGGDF